MDEVHQELIHLKQRVSEMAATYTCSPTRLPLHMASTNDAFSAQLIDTKAHLDYVQASLLTNGGPQPGTRSNHHDSQPSGQPSVPHAMNNLPHHGPSLPSAPLFWSLFNSLRSDVRALYTRTSDLEQNVSNLEDRVDHCLDPLTPTRSAADAADCYLLPNQSGAVPTQPYPAASGTGMHLPNYASSTVQQHAHQKSVELDASQGGAERFWAAEYCATGSDRYSVTSQQEAPAPEGVAFRDKEISDLEELMRTTQDSLRRSEESTSRREAYVQKLETANKDLNRSLHDRNSSLAEYCDILSDKQAEIERLRAECQTKDAALHIWASRHWDMQQSYLRKKSELSVATQQLQRMYDLHANSQEDIDDLANAKDDELQRLRAFCDSKDAIVSRQEQVINKGVILMEQKDDEIERVTHELELLRDDLNHEMRLKEHSSQLCEERGEVVARSRASLTPAPTPKTVTKDEGNSQSSNRAVEATYASFTTSGTPWHNSPVTKWAPKPFRCAQLPSERRRAEIWRSGPRSASHTFGKSGWHSNEGSVRLSDSVRLLERLALTEESLPQQQDDIGAEARKQRQSPHHGDDPSSSLIDPFPNAQQPPLPPRRRSSTAATESHASRQERARPIAKHISMRDLPRRRLQPYVEAGEDEIDQRAGRHRDA